MHKARYFELIAERPELVSNEAGGRVVVLTDPASIAQAEAETKQRLRSNGLPEMWGEVGLMYEDQYLLLLRDAVQFPNGSLGTYIRTVSPRASTPGVVILPMYEDQIVLVQHFRHATRSWHLELPRGFGEPGSTGASNARRELSEEIGAIATRLTSMGYMHPDTGIHAGHVELFFASLESVGAAEVQEGILAIRFASVAEFERLVSIGLITDGFSLAAYARAKLGHLI